MEDESTFVVKGANWVAALIILIVIALMVKSFAEFKEVYLDASQRTIQKNKREYIGGLIFMLKEKMRKSLINVSALMRLPLSNVFGFNNDESDFAEKGKNYAGSAVKIILFVIVAGVGLGVVLLVINLFKGQVDKIKGFIDQFLSLE